MKAKELSVPQSYRRPTPKPAVQPAKVCTIPTDIFTQSLGHYEQNQFARLLHQQFGEHKAHELLQRFQIGTSARWLGACVFWYIDERNRVRGGQIKLFADDWHTVKYVDQKGRKRTKVDWVHTALKYRLEKARKPLPEWLQTYIDNAERSPCLFGLTQLANEPRNKPVAIVEAPKTAVICSGYMPDFVWLAVGALSYLNRERLAPLRGRRIMLYPDLNAYADWSRRADQLRAEGFTIEVSDYLEANATDEQKQAGLDLADFMLTRKPTQPRWIIDGRTIYGEVLGRKADQYDLAELQSELIPQNHNPARQHIFWQSWPTPPLVWNKIRTHKFLQWAILPESNYLT